MDVEAVGRALGFTPEESRELAAYMRDCGYARVSLVASGTSWLELTYAGHKAIENLRVRMKMPRFVRWATDHPVAWPVLASVVTWVGAALVTKLIERFF
jgi:hypothetical protein